MRLLERDKNYVVDIEDDTSQKTAEPGEYNLWQQRRSKVFGLLFEGAFISWKKMSGRVWNTTPKHLNGGKILQKRDIH